MREPQKRSATSGLPPSLSEVVAGIVKRRENTEEATQRLETGLPGFDLMTGGGLRHSSVIVIGGPPGFGKTSFVTQVGVKAARDGWTVYFVTLELMVEEVVARMLAPIVGSSWPEVLETVSVERIQQAAAQLDGARFFIDDRPVVKEGEIRSRALAVSKQAPGPLLVVVDYLQRTKLQAAERRHGVAEAAYDLRTTANDLGCLVLAVSSVNRQAYDGKGSVGSFKESGDIEFSADVAAIMDRTDSGEHILRVVKNRLGRIGDLKVIFDGRLGVIEELTVVPGATRGSRRR